MGLDVKKLRELTEKTRKVYEDRFTNWLNTHKDSLAKILADRASEGHSDATFEIPASDILRLDPSAKNSSIFLNTANKTVSEFIDSDAKIQTRMVHDKVAVNISW